jgi:hypothetical protein
MHSLAGENDKDLMIKMTAEAGDVTGFHCAEVLGAAGLCREQLRTPVFSGTF